MQLTRVKPRSLLTCWWAFLTPMPDRAFTKSQPARMHICRAMDVIQVLLFTKAVT